MVKRNNVLSLLEFFEADMWYACHEEWKTEKDMLKYLRKHFDICLKGRENENRKTN